MNPLLTSITKRHIHVRSIPRIITYSTSTKSFFFVVTVSTVVTMITPASRCSLQSTLFTVETVTTHKQIQIVLIHIIQTTLVETTVASITNANLFHLTHNINTHTTNLADLTIRTAPSTFHLVIRCSVRVHTVHVIAFATIGTE